MSNTMYLVCVHHPEQIHALRLGMRDDRLTDGYKRVPLAARIEAWLAEHRICGGGHDHFTIAYAQAKDHDLPNPEPLADSVHLTLREAANTPEA